MLERIKFKLLIYPGLVLFIIIVLGGFLALRNLYIEKHVDETKTVYVKKTESGFQLIRNGEPFIIRGGAGDSHFKELAEIGGNTIRVFDTTDLKDKLDEAHKHGLAVIVDIYIPSYSTSYNLYDDDDENMLLKQSIRDLVFEFKDHPALLIWNLGNEINYPLVFRKNDFIRIFNELVSIIQEVDPNHPVSTSIIGAGRKAMSSIFFHSPELDIIAFNTFGNTKFVNRHIAQISFLFGPRPYFFSELGPTGPWESSFTSWGAPIEPTSTIKSEHYRTRMKMIKDNEAAASLGSLLFYWGSKLERTHTWFSLFKDGYKSEIINLIETLWKQPGFHSELDEKNFMLASNEFFHNETIFSPDESNHTDVSSELIGLDYMLVNDKASHENIIFYPGELSHAEVFFHDDKNDNVRIKWEIYPEAWHSDTSEIVVSNYKPIDTFVNFESNKTTFQAPITEGPYRIFAYIYDQEGYYATTNTPFYVLKNK